MTSQFLCMNSWAGRTEHPVEVISTKGKYSQVRLLADVPLLPGRRSGKEGEVIRVPSYSIKEVKDSPQPDKQV